MKEEESTDLTLRNTRKFPSHTQKHMEFHLLKTKDAQSCTQGKEIVLTGNPKPPYGNIIRHERGVPLKKRGSFPERRGREINEETEKERRHSRAKENFYPQEQQKNRLKKEQEAD